VKTGLAVTLLVIGALGCKREERRTAELAALAVPVSSRAVSEESRRAEQIAPDPLGYEENAYAVAEGKRLFTWFNCVGCHGHGGGGSGPALMDSAWRYGSEPNHIYATIAEGRPNGMPSFGNKLTTQQLHYLVAYVRALGGLVRLDVAPGRSDTLSPHAPEAMRIHGGLPPVKREVARP
jgi:cytochrome c oxidase cbb3-type subunit III